jgi:hypothetical protein
VACWAAINLTTFYNYFYQGTGNFDVFFRVNVAVKVMTIGFVSCVVWLHAASSRNLVWRMFIPVFATAVIYEYLWRRSAESGEPVRTPQPLARAGGPVAAWRGSPCRECVSFTRVHGRQPPGQPAVHPAGVR